MTKENMFDIQHLDMNYEGYYFIPWPDSQFYEEYVGEGGVILAEDGCFVNMQWIADEANNQTTDDYDC